MDITNINAIAAARVSQGSHTLWKQGNDLSWENQGNLREFTKLPREFFKTAKSQGMAMADLSAASGNVT